MHLIRFAILFILFRVAMLPLFAEEMPAPESKVQPVSVAVAGFVVSANDSKLMKLSEEIRQMLEQKLAEGGAVVVDRTKLKEAIQEAKLSQAGMMDGDSAKQLGKMLGADYIVSGRLTEMLGNFVVTGRAVDTETTVVIPVSAEAAEQKDVLATLTKSSSQLLEKLKVAKAAKAKVVKNVADPSLPKGPRPQILTLFREEHLTRAVPDPASETGVVRYLLANDFKVIDPAFVKSLREDAEKFQALTAGKEAIPKLAKLGEEKSADVIIVGEAFSERGTSVEGMVSCRARVEVKAIHAKSGNVIAYDSEHGGASDLAEHVAGKKAIEDAVSRVMPRLAAQILAKWQNPEGVKEKK